MRVLVQRVTRASVTVGAGTGAEERVGDIGAGTGLIYLLRWYWWRLNGWGYAAGFRPGSDVPYTALVPCNLYGPRDHFGAEGNHFMAAAVHKVERARIAGVARAPFITAMSSNVFRHLGGKDLHPLTAGSFDALRAMPAEDSRGLR